MYRLNRAAAVVIFALVVTGILPLERLKTDLDNFFSRIY
jgi:hypothetical protein